MTYAAKDADQVFEDQNTDFKFCAAVASFGMVLRDSPHKGASTEGLVLDLATAGKGTDLRGLREEFIGLVKAYQAIAPRD